MSHTSATTALGKGNLSTYIGANAGLSRVATESYPNTERRSSSLPFRTFGNFS